MEGRDGLVQQDAAVLVGAVGPLGGLQRREAVEEEGVVVHWLAPEKRPQHDDRVLETTRIDQRLGGGNGDRGWHGGRRGWIGRMLGTPGRDSHPNAGDHCENETEGAAVHYGPLKE